MHFLDPIHKTGLMCQRWRKNKLQGYYRSFILIFLYLLQGYVMLDSWILLALLCVYFHNKYSSKNGKVIIEVKDTTTKLYYCLLLVVQPQKKGNYEELRGGKRTREASERERQCKRTRDSLDNAACSLFSPFHFLYY